jgi:hypothetical protein
MGYISILTQLKEQHHVSVIIECEATPNRSGLTGVSSFGTPAFND